MFGPKFSHFCFFFPEILQIDKFEGADFKYDKYCFQIPAQNTQIKHFWSQLRAFLFFHEILQLDKVEGPNFK